MDERVELVLEDYLSRFDREEALIPGLAPEEMLERRDDFLLAVGPAVGQLLNLLVRELHPYTVVEVGASYGYSTVWLAEAARAVGSRLVSMEIVPGKVDYARSRLAEAGLQEQVNFMIGDAQDSIRALEGPVDFVLMDLWKELYTPCFELLLPRLSQGALIVADNMMHPEHFREDAARYRQAVAATGEFDTIVLPIGDGIALSRRRQTLTGSG
jgi:predicted O-methyltransferase YrrM